jgi:hypothetical protein
MAKKPKKVVREQEQPLKLNGELNKLLKAGLSKRKNPKK